MFNILLYVFVFIFGLIVGSFLNCLIYRIEVKKSLLRDRSFCPHCKHTLSWLDLIPIISFISLAGKCRYCKGKISWQYPLVELFTATAFLLVFIFKFMVPGVFSVYFFVRVIYYWIAFAFLIVIFVYDLKHYLILNGMIYPAIIISLAFCLYEGYLFGYMHLVNYLAAAFGAALFFLTIVLVTRGKGMGIADIKFALFMGLILGYPNILIALMLAFYAGAIVGVGLIFLKRKKLESEIPFAPFLIVGTLVALFWGANLIHWYQLTF